MVFNKKLWAQITQLNLDNGVLQQEIKELHGELAAVRGEQALQALAVNELLKAHREREQRELLEGSSAWSLQNFLKNSVM
jgi:hypothetical protein